MFPNAIVFVEIEGSSRIYIANAPKESVEIAHKHKRVTNPSKPIKSLIVPTVKSAMRYIPRA